MVYSPKLFVRDWWIGIPLLIIMLAQIGVWWYLLSNIHSGLGQIFLHYNIVFGVDLVGEWWKILYLPAAGLIVFVANYSIALLTYRSDKFLARLMSVWALFFHVLLLISAHLLVRINV